MLSLGALAPELLGPSDSRGSSSFLLFMAMCAARVPRIGGPLVATGSNDTCVGRKDDACGLQWEATCVVVVQSPLQQLLFFSRPLCIRAQQCTL